MNLSHSDTATILHGLRLIQEAANGPADCTAGCCGHFDACDALTDEQIDELCERINQEELPIINCTQTEAK
jgi:hypothetical protein